MDDLFHRRLMLALRLARRLEGVSLLGESPRTLRDAVGAETPGPWAELHDEALRLHEDAALAERRSPNDARAAAWLEAQARALSAVARVGAGDEIAYPDLVEELLDIEAVPVPVADLDRPHRLLDAALPAGPSLRSRLAAHRRAVRLPLEAIEPAALRLLERYRARAAEDLAASDAGGGNGTAPEAAVELDVVEGPQVGWRTRVPADGTRRTTIQINGGVPWTLVELAEVVAREAFPGRHLLLEGRAAAGLPALLLRPSPDWSLLEGLGAVGGEVLLGDFELAADLRRLAREHDVPADVERDLEIRRARRELRCAVANAALLLHHDGLPENEVRSHLAETALLEPDEVDETMRLLADPIRRVEPIAGAVMPGLVRGWLETAGQTVGLQRLLGELLTPGQLRIESAAVA